MDFYNNGKTGSEKFIEILYSILEFSDCAECIIDSGNSVLAANSSFCDLIKMKRSSIEGKRITDILFFRLYNIPIVILTDDNTEYPVSRNVEIDEQKYIFEIHHLTGAQSALRLVKFSKSREKYLSQEIYSAIVSIAHAVNSEASQEEIYRFIHKSLSKLLPVRNFYIAVLDEKNDKLNFPYIADVYAESRGVSLKYSTDRGLTSYIIRIGSAEIFRENDIIYLIRSKKIEEFDTQYKVWAGVPLKIKDKMIGAIVALDYENPDAINESDLKIMEFVSEQIAHTIERKKYEEEILSAKKVAEDSNRLKSEFLAQISHEIRTPLNAILSISDFLKSELNPSLSNELKECFNLVERGGRRLIRTIDLILNVSQANTGFKQIEIERVDILKDVVCPVVEQFKTIAEAKGLLLNLETETDNTVVECNQYMVTQIFINLIDNAIKYTLYGVITLKVKMNKLNQLQVDVADTGIGITEEFLPHLFDVFSQEETGYTRKYDGTGLGLALAKRYSELNGAEIKVKSEKGKGSVFSVVFI